MNVLLIALVWNSFLFIDSASSLWKALTHSGSERGLRKNAELDNGVVPILVLIACLPLLAGGVIAYLMFGGSLGIFFSKDDGTDIGLYFMFFIGPAYFWLMANTYVYSRWTFNLPKK